MPVLIYRGIPHKAHTEKHSILSNIQTEQNQNNKVHVIQYSTIYITHMVYICSELATKHCCSCGSRGSGSSDRV